MAFENEITDRLILEDERYALTRLSRATWFRMERAGLAPRRIKLSPRRVGWRLSHIEQWILSRSSDVA